MSPDQLLLHSIAHEPGTPLPLQTSPLFKALATELLAYDLTTGAIKISFKPGSDFFQGGGVVQGGIVGTLLDFAMALSLLGKLPPGALLATLSYTVNLIAPVREERVIAEGWIEWSGRRTAFLGARLTTAAIEPILIATATSTVSIFEPRTPS